MLRIALVPYTKGWSYDFTAQALQQHLSDRFEIEVLYREDLDGVRWDEFDLFVDFWWRGSLARRFPRPVAKQVSSHRWSRPRWGNYQAAALAKAHLRRNVSILVPSRRLEAELAPHSRAPVELCPKGFHPETFGDAGDRRGALVVGWAGNRNAADKNVGLLLKAWPELRIAGGTLSQAEMPDWYNSVDVITCASDAEGDPRPLIEGMACGCFPVVVDVGIVPELVIADDSPIDRGEGFVVYSRGIVVERDVHAFAAAFAWCRENLDVVRASGRNNADEMLLTRTWKQCAAAWGDTFDRAIKRGLG